MEETRGRVAGRDAGKIGVDPEGSADPGGYGASSGERCAMKVACAVREGAVGKGPTRVGTSLAAYFTPNADRNGSDRGKCCREPCLDQRRVDLEKSDKTLL